jgi:hypothetical protein
MNKVEKVAGKDDEFLVAFKSDLLEFVGIRQKGGKSKSVKFRIDQ